MNEQERYERALNDYRYRVISLLNQEGDEVLLPCDDMKSIEGKELLIRKNEKKSILMKRIGSKIVILGYIGEEHKRRQKYSLFSGLPSPIPEFHRKTILAKINSIAETANSQYPIVTFLHFDYSNPRDISAGQFNDTWQQ